MAHDTAAHRLETASASWEALEELFGVKGEPSRCWCRWFALPGKEFRSTAPNERKELLLTRFDEDPEPGVLAFRGGQAVGWCAVEPRHRGSYGKVRIMGPSAVIATVCSLCAALFPLEERRVHSSSSW